MIGKTISHYKIVEKIGEGGMGVVYKAQDFKLDRFVALKFLPPHLTTNEDEKQRFIHEAKAASSLDHNNICNIYEIDETDDGRLFIAMACYEGETLDNRIKEKPLPIEEVIDITIQIAQGLAKAHEKEIVHRDVKPANIMMTKEDVVKVLDFGLAKLSTQTKLTKESTTLGTASYMSPEQAKGEDVDQRTDIWSLGVIIYEMLSGQLPFKGEYESAVIYSIMNDRQEPVTGLRTGVPMEMERIINKCLQKNSTDRYQHIDDMIVDLKGFNSESFGIASKEERQKNRSKSVLLPLAIISIIFLIIVVYFLIQQNEKSTSEWENSIAVLPFSDLSPEKDQKYFCDGMTEQIITNLTKLNRLKVIAFISALKAKETNQTMIEMGKELGVSHILEGSVRKYGNKVRITAQLVKTQDGSHLWAEDYDRELINIVLIQDDISEKIGEVLLKKLSDKDVSDLKSIIPSSVEAYEFYMKGRYYHYNKYWGATISRDDFKTSEQMFLKAIDLDPEFALSYANLADLYNTYCNTTVLTESEYNNYLRIQRFYLNRALALNSNLVEVQIINSWIHHENDEIYEAYKSIRRALKLNPNNSYANFTMARFFHSRGLIYLANKYFVKAIETDPLQPMNYAWNGYCLNLMGKYQESENNLKRALDIDPDHFVTIIYYIWLLIVSERYDEASMMLANYYEVYGKNKHMISLRAMLFAIGADKENALKKYPAGHYYKYYIYAVLRLVDASIEYLNDIFNDRWAQIEESRYIELKMNPLLDSLRSDPRFQEILAKHKELYEENLEKYGDVDI